MGLAESAGGFFTCIALVMWLALFALTIIGNLVFFGAISLGVPIEVFSGMKPKKRLDTYNWNRGLE